MGMNQYIKDIRKLAGNLPLLVCGASVILENDRGEVLLILRSDNKMWAYPGGCVDINEIVEETAKRELLEEAGVTANSLEMFGVFSGEDLFYTYTNGDQASIVDIVYLCKDYYGTIKADMIESDDVRFFSLDNLPKNISPPCIPAIMMYKELKQR